MRQNFQRFIIEEVIDEEDSERTEHNNRKKHRSEDLLISPRIEGSKNMICQTPKKTSPRDSPALGFSSFKKSKKTTRPTLDSEVPSMNNNRGQHVLVCDSVTSSEVTNQFDSTFKTTPEQNEDEKEPSKTTNQFNPFGGANEKLLSKTYEDFNQIRGDDTARSHTRTNSSSRSGKKYVLGIKPELAEVLNKFNEIPLELRKEIEILNNSANTSPVKKNLSID